MLRSTRLSPSIDRNNAENYPPKAEQAHSCILNSPNRPGRILSLAPEFVALDGLQGPRYLAKR